MIQKILLKNKTPKFSYAIFFVAILGLVCGFFSIKNKIAYASHSLPVSSSVITSSATSVNAMSAMLHGSVSIGAGVTITEEDFNWGLSTSYTGTPIVSLVSISSGTLGSTYLYSYVLTGLSCGTTYHYRATANTSIDSPVGGDSSFTTSACPSSPVVTTTLSSSVTSSSVVLSGSITSVGSYATTASAVGFVYGTTTAYGATSTNTGSYHLGSFSLPVTGLSCATTYHYKAFATNYYTSYGSTDMTFVTGACIGASGNVSGYAWSSNTGWISLDCAHGSSTGGNICSTSMYSVNMIPNPSTQSGVFSGYAWSSGVGWISFNSIDVSSCGVGVAGAPTPGAQASVDFTTGTTTSGHVSGWIRALSSTTGWDGCISLRGGSGSSSYGVSYIATSTTHNLVGYAWGGTTVGWIDFTDSHTSATLTIPAPSASLNVSTHSLTSAGGPVAISWTTANLATTNCTASSTAGDWTGAKTSGGGSESLSIPANTSTSSITQTYTLGGCKSLTGATVASTSTSITIDGGAGPSLVFLANGAGSTSPLSINSGDSVDLTWQVENISHGTCAGSSSGTGAPFVGWNGDAKSPLSTDSSVGATPVTYEEIIPSGVVTSTRAYTITCTGTSTVSQTVNINVLPVDSPAPSLSLTVNGSASLDLGSAASSTVSLDWVSTNLDSSDCTAESSLGDWTGFISSSGGSVSQVIPVNTGTTTRTITYTITGCLHSGAVVPDQTVTITQPGSTVPTFSFLADGLTEDHIQAGQAVTLSWQVQNISGGCSGTSDGSYSNWNSTTKAPALSATTATTVTEIIGSDGSIVSNRTYTLNCFVGTTPMTPQSVTIVVDNLNGPAVDLTMNGQSSLDLPSSGGSIIPAWSTTNLDSVDCIASSTAGDWSGTKSYLGGVDSAISIPANTTSTQIVQTYTLSCTTQGATISTAVTVTIAAVGDPFLSFTATNGVATDTSLTILPTDSITLSWRVQNISSCRGTSTGSFTNWANTVKSLTTTYDVLGVVPSSRAFALTCIGTDGSTIIRTVSLTLDTTGSSGGHGRDYANLTLAVNGEPSIIIPPIASTVNVVWATDNLSSSGCTASSSNSSWTGAVSSTGGSHPISYTATTSSITHIYMYLISGCVNASTGAMLAPRSVTVTIAPYGVASLISFAGNGSSSGGSITAVSGSTVTLSWQVQYVAGNACVGTSSGAFGDWDGVEQPSTSVTTAQTYYRYVTAMTGTNTYTLDCGTAGVKNVTVIVAPLVVLYPNDTSCVGFCGAISPPSINAVHRPPWMEI